MESSRLARSAAAIAAALLATAAAAGDDAPPIEVCVTVPDLASICREVGGDRLSITTFTRGAQDPHFLDPRPSFIRALSGADLFIQAGLDLESGWAPVLLRSARNARIQPGSRGHLDASERITPIAPPSAGGAVDRSAGDVHPRGNPHYLLDPLNGLAVAALIRDRLAELRPAYREAFAAGYTGFRKRLLTALLGERLVEALPEEDLEKAIAVLAHPRGGLDVLLRALEEEKRADLLGGWLGAMRAHRGLRVVADHDLWPYFARRFGVDVAAFLEPKPGIAPTTKHLTALIGKMRGEGIAVILAAPYFDERHARFVAGHTGAAIVAMAHQTGAREDAASYIEMIDHDVRALVEALEKRAPEKPE